MCFENYKTVLKDTGEDPSKYKDNAVFLCLILSLQFSPNWSTGSMLSLKILIAIFTKIDKLILIFMWKCKGSIIAK